MNSPKQFDYLDSLFAQALQPQVRLRAPEGMWQRIKTQVQPPTFPRWRRVLERLGVFRITFLALSDANALFPSEARLLAMTGMLQEQRRMILLMA